MHFIITRIVLVTRRKTIYEYHRVQFKQEDIRNGTTIYLKLLPTCVAFTDCQSCLTNHTGFVVSPFRCFKCLSVGFKYA